MGCGSVCRIGLNRKKGIDETKEYAEFLDALLWVNHFTTKHPTDKYIGHAHIDNIQPHTK
jgi:hypothetical protein